MGTRETANTNTSTTLQFQFLSQGIPYDAYSVDQVTIHASEEDAINNENIIQTIPSYSIVHTSTGLYTYVVNTISTEGVYYDKIFITPTSTVSQIYFINDFFVSVAIISTTCNVTGTIIDYAGNPIEGVRIYAIPTTIPAIVQTSTGVLAMTTSTQETVTDINGYFRLGLLRNVSFNIVIKEIGLQNTVMIPNSESTDLFSLLGIQVQASSGPSNTDWV